MLRSRDHRVGEAINQRQSAFANKHHHTDTLGAGVCTVNTLVRNLL